MKTCMRVITVLLIALIGLPLSVLAQEWGAFATISSTMGVSGSRICIGEASRQDIGCPSYAPSISATTGHTTFGGGVTANNVSLTTSGTQWGYLGSTGTYLPNLASNAVSASNISTTTINGVPVSSLGASATVVSGTTTMVSSWPDALICNNTGWGQRVLYLAGAPASDGIYYYADTGYGSSGFNIFVGFNANGTYNTAYQGGEMNATGGCYNKTISELYTEGKAFNFIGNSGSGGGGGSGTSDRIVGTNANVVAGSGTVSITTGGVSGTAYFDTTGRLVVPGVSVTSNNGVSTTNMYVSGRVGLGAATTPSFTLDILSTASDVQRIKRTTGGGGATLRIENGNGNSWRLTNAAEENFALNYNGVNMMIISPTLGYMGVGTNGPTAMLDVSGSMISRPRNAGSSTSIDFTNANAAYTTANCGAFTLSGMQDGGTYTLVVQGTTSGTCSFTHSGLTVRLPPSHGATTAGTHTLYSFQRLGANVYTSWIRGY